MKKLSLALLCIFALSLSAYAQDYYWYKGKQIPLQRGNQRYIIYEGNDARGLDSLRIIETGDVSASKNQNLKWAVVDQKSEIIAPNVIYQTPSFYGAGTKHDMFVTHRFSVKLKSDKDFAMLQQYANKYNAEIEKDKYLPLWYILTCDFNAPYNALDLANIFYETGLFAISEPEFTHVALLDCVNDYYFANQWNLKNTGQYGASYSGIDINYCDAHAITTGDSSVIIGVYDLGVDLTHPDINLYSFSYDANTRSSPSTIYTRADGNNYHGTACAGIIGAKTNNTIGDAGIAPNCPIMSISFNNTTTTKIRDAFIVAANNGCSVISNSWHLSSPSEDVDAGISYALSQGRNGKGCVVVFSAGNENRDSINYPANSNDSILVVGAMSPCGERCNPNSCDGEYLWGSNYGNKLDVVAPGVKIRTTDLVGEAGNTLSDYMAAFKGTSSACPHAAGIAGLILSVNPYLTQKEVVDIIESTAQKVGSYSYTSQSGRLNGTWNYQMGYGLVDAYAAVLAAKNRLPSIGGLDVLCSAAMYGINNMPSTATVVWSYETDIIPEPFLPVIHILNPTASLTEIQRGTSCFALYNPSQCYYNGTVTLKATITDFGLTRLCTKDILLNEDITPTIPLSQRRKIGLDETRTFCIDNCTDVPTNKLKWVITLPSATSSTTYYGRCWSITTGMLVVHPGTMNIKLYNLENCDPTLYTDYNIKISYLIPVPDPSLSFANPVTTGAVDITITDRNYAQQDGDAEVEKREDIDYTLELWSENTRTVRTVNGTLKGEKDAVTMDVSNLPNGIYFLTMKVDNEILTTEKMIIIH